MKAIIESVKKTISVKNKMEWFKSMREVVEHNHSNLINKLYRLPDSFVEFQKYHNQYFNIKQNLI
jgi:N-methylhydantoinase B/oxoprolinase/acetone carboxylase alpha subunit